MTSEIVSRGTRVEALVPLWHALLAWLAAIPAATSRTAAAYTHRPRHALRAPHMHQPVGEHSAARHYEVRTARALIASRVVCGALVAAALLIVWHGLDVGAMLGLMAVAAGRPGRAAGSVHAEPHPLAGKTVALTFSFDGPGEQVGTFRVEDYWDRVSGGSWMTAVGNPAALKYAIRTAAASLPMDDEVVYGKDEHGRGHLVHVSELGDETTAVQG